MGMRRELSEKTAQEQAGGIIGCYMYHPNVVPYSFLSARRMSSVEANCRFTSQDGRVFFFLSFQVWFWCWAPSCQYIRDYNLASRVYLAASSAISVRPVESKSMTLPFGQVSIDQDAAVLANAHLVREHGDIVKCSGGCEIVNQNPRVAGVESLHVPCLRVIFCVGRGLMI